jgi:DNA-binding MarR family transcriptional regulator
MYYQIYQLLNYLSIDYFNRICLVENDMAKIDDYHSMTRDIVSSIRWLVRTVDHEDQSVGREFGLTSAQSCLISTLAAHGPLSSADLSRHMFVTAANITGIVDRLESKDLVHRTRQTGDRRVVLVSLTDAGRELGKLLPDPIERRLSLALTDMPPEQVQEFSSTLQKLLHLLDSTRLEAKPLGLDQA